MAVLTKSADQSLQSIKLDLSRLPDIKLINRELEKVLSEDNGMVNGLYAHVLKTGGKRIRPLLVLYSGYVFSSLSDKLLDAAVAAELIHMASLVHDDIIDDSLLRHGQPTVNKIWGSHSAVLCGDYLFARAFGILSGKRLLKSLDFMVEAIQGMCCGEILQAQSRFNIEMDRRTYYEIISKKTAIFMECCCKSGAAAAGAGEFQVRLMGEYGLNLGFAFQIIDDILDFTGKSDIMGKPRCENLAQGLVTLPVLLLLEDKRYGQRIKEMLVRRQFTREEMDWVTLLLKESGKIDEAFHIAGEHIQKAGQCLELLKGYGNTHRLLHIAEMVKMRMN